MKIIINFIFLKTKSNKYIIKNKYNHFHLLIFLKIIITKTNKKDNN